MEHNRSCSRLSQGTTLYNIESSTVAMLHWQVLVDTHGKLSAHMMPTCYKVFPLLKQLQSEWETLCEDNKYFPVKHALDAGLKNMGKWY